jgi:HEAT repeat protein
MTGLDYYLAEFNSGSEQRADAAALRLAHSSSEQLPVYQALLTHPSNDVRWWTVRALAESKDIRALKLLVQAIKDPDTTVSQCAALALRQQPDPDAIPALVEMLKSPDALLARLAGDALIATGEAAIPALEEVMSSGSQAQRIQAVRALALIGDQRSIPLLFKALEDPSAWIEYWANEGLERMGVGMTFFNP